MHLSNTAAEGVAIREKRRYHSLPIVRLIVGLLVTVMNNLGYLVSSFSLSRSQLQRTLAAQMRNLYLLNSKNSFIVGVYRPDLVTRLFSCSARSEVQSKDQATKQYEMNTSVGSGCATFLDKRLLHGHCVGIRTTNDLLLAQPLSMSTTEWLHKHLHPDEISYAESLTAPQSQQSFVLGRLAMRQALKRSQTRGNHPLGAPILKDEYGRPIVPSGWIGSISHKRNIGIALVAPREEGCTLTVGVDLERTIMTGRRNVTRWVLTKREQAHIGQLSVCNGCGFPFQKILLIRCHFSERFIRRRSTLAF